MSVDANAQSGGGKHSNSSEHKERKDKHPKDLKDSKSKDPNRKRPNRNDDQFLCSLQYQNTLPSVPSGPFFKQISPVYSFTQYATFQVSSLEKSYVWQPHFGPDAGIKLDLVDQESILLDSSTLANEADKKIFSAQQTAHKNKNHRAELVLPAWLRESPNLDTTIYRDEKKLKEEPAAKKTRVSDDPYSVEQVEQSFTAVIKTLQQLEQKSGPARKLEWSVDIVPAGSLLEELSIVRFDEDIEALLRQSEDATTQRVLPILTNGRSLKQDEKLKEFSSTVAVSLIAPSSFPPEDNTIASPDEEYFDWVADFKMDVTKEPKEVLGLSEHFVVAVNESNLAEGAKYRPVFTRLRLNKLVAEERDPHDAFVSRIQP